VAISSSSLPNTLSIWRYKRTNKSYTETLGEGVDLTLMLISTGEFLMGASKDELEREDNEIPQHLVKVSQFLMGRYAVTQAQWRMVADYKSEDRELNADPSNFKGDHRPVENVSWEEAQEFCKRLSKHSGKIYRLPSEAEWEYACRAGTETPFHFGETISTELAKYDGTFTYNNSPKGKFIQETADVGSFPANDWGLFDMHGNVWEWCQDNWHSNYEGAPIDGSAWLTENENDPHIARGGSWNFNPRACRSAYRYFGSPVSRDYIIGFRLVCDLPRTL
jgi:formylglycine-generating enzyme required for sulfatase activity